MFAITLMLPHAVRTDQDWCHTIVMKPKAIRRAYGRHFCAAEKLDIPEKYHIQKGYPEGSECKEAAEDLIDRGCTLIISNSYGHQYYMEEVANEYKDIYFIAMTGDYAAVSGLDNFFNGFTKVYESRFVSGVVAGMKLKELIENDKLDQTKASTVTVMNRYVGAHLCRKIRFYRSISALSRL